jgi:hypothetical protein
MVLNAGLNTDTLTPVPSGGSSRVITSAVTTEPSYSIPKSDQVDR